MKLLSIELFGRYKGLKDQAFDFSMVKGDVVVLIGANGSGKSQVMELIAETFAYLERQQRKDFRVRGPLGYDFRVTYEMASFRYEGLRRFVVDTRNGLRISLHQLVDAPHDGNGQPSQSTWQQIKASGLLEDLVLPRVIGYASGMSENLQRAFMRNALQYFDVIRVRASLKNELAQPKVDEEATLAINERYLKRNPGIFAPEGQDPESGLFRLRETDTAIPGNLFLDYDCAALLIAMLGMLSHEDRDAVWHEIPFRHPTRVVLRYDLRGQATATDNAHDIKRLIELAGPGGCMPISPKTSESQYELLELDYLAGHIVIDFQDPKVINRMANNSREPDQWFSAFYKLQLLGVDEWSGTVKRALRRDGFQGHVEKPLKGKLPLSVQELWMSDGDQIVAFDDLSDGEVQLLLTLGAVRLFGDDETLFLYDEPETHLNPSWRTRFHLDFEKANGKAQAIVSSHSPFLVSSLPREAVFHFKKVNGATEMTNPPGETFGASFDVLIKKHFNLRATISETAVQEIRERLADDQLTTQEKLDWLEESVGESMERSYLINRLRAG
ncbi:putative ATPase [Achromobacter deleyi]|uniref:AAA family ATPase n=1 Tax=Achromobacter deleyi TaxID=1353891 RepID=UPI002856E918|nr:AAA family ATPase [Achromobacter deleyi]MDR6601944.1 putative ATPase [Achromobacter deleyi]